VDHYTYVIASDGDFMEGVASEACSLAGHLGLGKLIVLYDDNRVSLAGSTDLAFTEDVGMRFQAYGWDVHHVQDGNDLKAVDGALTAARAETARPSLIAVRTVIGFGSPHKQGSFETHGSPLGAEELQATKEHLGWPLEPDFLVPEEVAQRFQQVLIGGQAREAEWDTLFSRYGKAYPELIAEFRRRMSGDLPAQWDADLPVFDPDPKGIATRKASEMVLQVMAPRLPELMGGSADLNPSTFSWLKGYGDFQPPGISSEGVQGVVGGEWGYSGRNIHFGVREHAMGAVATGMALHGGFIPYTATFLTFSDYMRPPMRLAALSQLRVIYIFTHDSIGLGEDGPTHQPIEQVMNLRLVPNLTVIRPADAAETVRAWCTALRNQDGPTALILTRQAVPVLDRAVYVPAEAAERGGYIVWQSSRMFPQAILIGTGSELPIALEAAHRLASEGLEVRVVSLPSWEVFERQPEEYRHIVLSPEIEVRVAVEAGIRIGWERYVGMKGIIIGMDGFGASAPYKVLYEKFGITSTDVVHAVKSMLDVERGP